METQIIRQMALPHEKLLQEPMEPTSNQVTVFKDLMNPTPKPSATETMLSAIQEKSVRLESALQSAKLESVQQLTPEKMLATQIGLVQSIIEVDLVAKTAGSAAQSVNKLTSMQ